MPNYPVTLANLTRRHFFGATAAGLGGAALTSLLTQQGLADSLTAPTALPAKAKRVIYLFQSGGPAQQDLFDYKPLLNEKNGQQLPPEVRGAQRLTGMSAQQSSIPLAGSHFKFAQHGQSGAWLSDLLPHHREIADDLCIVKSMWTEAINHDPAITFFQTGSQIAGRPSLGAWLSYGLGSMNDDLPSFIVLVTAKHGGDQPLYARLWGSGFLDSQHQGVQFRPGAEPVLYLSNPDGVCRSGRRAMLDKLSALNQRQFEQELDPEIESRITQYEMAFRMQTSVPDATDLSQETDATFDLYGPDSRTPGTFAANCLLARRLAERGVRFIQLYHQGWDHHGSLPAGISNQCRETDQASAALVKDLKQRGLLDDTLVIWGGEFGRQPTAEYAEGTGRDHNSYGFTMWMAGGGIKGGVSVGSTDELGARAVDRPLTVKEMHATVLHQMGLDPNHLSYFYNGLDQKLVGVEGAEPIREVIA
jgi:hypothetical protein